MVRDGTVLHGMDALPNNKHAIRASPHVRSGDRNEETGAIGNNDIECAGWLVLTHAANRWDR